MAWELGGGGGQGEGPGPGPTFENINLNMPDPMFRRVTVTVASLSPVLYIFYSPEGIPGPPELL
jgi:hypothetical protein